MGYRYDNEVVLTPPFLETVYRSQRAPVTVLKEAVINQERREVVLGNIAHRAFKALYAGIVEFPTFTVEDPTNTTKIEIPTRIRVHSYTKIDRTNVLVPELGERTGYEAQLDLVSPYTNISAEIQLGSLMLRSNRDGDEMVEAIHLARRSGNFEVVDTKPGAPANIEADQFALLARAYLLNL